MDKVRVLDRAIRELLPITRKVLSAVVETRPSTSGLIMAKARRKVDSSAGPRAAPSPASTSGPASAHFRIGFSTHIMARSGNARVTAAVRLDNCRRP